MERGLAALKEIIPVHLGSQVLPVSQFVTLLMSDRDSPGIQGPRTVGCFEGIMQRRH
jgi:hypothetical protein